MSRKFIIEIDSSWQSGVLNGNTVSRPIIQQTNSIAALKNTYKVYNMFVEKQDMGTKINNSQNE